jgi:rRNA maturation endonuclease Nob1
MVKYFCDICGKQVTLEEIEESTKVSSYIFCKNCKDAYDGQDPLKSCPFCGSPAEIIYMKNGQKYPRCTGKAGGGYCYASSFPNEKDDGFRYMADAIHVWNRRPLG